uniref:Uncharacterized protein n=1 Tax=Setaria viridis TaxID=4556 RepID=A0A4U6TUA6_SETVI|nr:hypothetical protein SEVIR_7G103900v2 [Setaria viridis]
MSSHLNYERPPSHSLAIDAAISGKLQADTPIRAGASRQVTVERSPWRRGSSPSPSLPAGSSWLRPIP